MGRGPTSAYHKDMMEGYVKGSLTCLTDETIKNEINTDFPLVLNVEPTNACNLKCYICPRNKSGREVGYMDFGLYTRIIDQCREYRQLRMLNFHKDGESLLHPKLFEMIKYAKDSNVARVLHLNTNAVCLEGDNIENFLISGIDDVTISLDAYYPETFEKIKGRALLGKVENNVVNLFRTRDRLKLKKPFIRIKIMEFEDTYGEIEDFIKKWQDIADDVQVTGLHDWSGSIEDVEVTDEVHVKGSRFPCVLLWYTMAINWDGNVSICNLDWDLSGIIGDVNKKPLHEIWNGERIKQIRKDNLMGKYGKTDVCRDCVVWAAGTNLKDWFLSKEEFYNL